ncbi:hypothetical protein FOB58_005143 [Candida parapsilosis]|uniref:Uncharacterized protein n=2 Tax=Candida parapsilosis TaxID=5480 RepID=G8B5L7_CANPC|nr:uncharacterized protein CPAR2_603280 [Candida parapsilosis]KAF6043428.1 hypothetical protein FOB58_005143 [Candida parapsilosis]KAF6044075.1 hypothetical protein FOB59_005031 [Candida parapsilosis]KAF6045305.1 hypothetical protein FOB60_004877 [Candida parapsilosis]KAF6060092.1 hypothetical protein FOB61_005107 [Candida parapsilosis]KAI5901515.1 hypothetical protein K4G60_g652 [Candida parapsilosis]
MPTPGGFAFSLASGAAIRLFQTGLSGSPPKLSQKLIGYASIMTLTGSFYYFILDPSINANRELLSRRLAALREQRERKSDLVTFEEQEHRLFTAKDKGRFFRLFDKYSQPYK